MTSWDLFAMWLGYALMAGCAAGGAGLVLCWGIAKLFWSGGRESLAFLQYMRWVKAGRERAPWDKDEPAHPTH
jgi:hypothetical protein